MVESRKPPATYCSLFQTYARMGAVFVASTLPIHACQSNKDSLPPSPPVSASAFASTSASAVSLPTAAASDGAADGDVRRVLVEQLEIDGDLPAFVVRGKKDGFKMVFLHGLCGNPYAYALSFRHAAARLGTLLALQGNISCGSDFRDWSCPPSQVDARIERAFRALGDESDLRNLILIGYSSGATYAELLVLRNPSRYALPILIASPQKPAYFRLRKARGVVLMAGERDRHDLMKSGLRDLSEREIPSAFFILPGATHGEMGNDAENVMENALLWIVRNALADSTTAP
ncbi:MAG TPA: alpha/beta hydrolase [Polyangiaceae bacterium]|nr:alpha/beta hydrolase [Polyangiaceae bacterium]